MSAALYIHVPFCRRKCIYCDFYSVTQLSRVKSFLSALRTEIQLSANRFQAISFSTIYLGGGTPSLLSPKEMSGILDQLFETFTILPDAEISIEVNPGALLAHHLAGYKKAGFNRLTIGVQSFFEKDLKFLTRIHTAEEAVFAIRAARRAGFENIGVDLIFGVVGGTMLRWQENIQKVVDFSPEHISIYGLTYEEGTPLQNTLRSGMIEKCDEELERDMLLYGARKLRDAGYEHYEISNFARPGCRSRHNQKYWDGSSFIGFGPSAHSYDGLTRWWNVCDLSAYTEMLAKGVLPVAGQETLRPDDRIHELILLGLRRREGLDLRTLSDLVGLSVETIVDRLRRVLGELDTSPPFCHSSANFLLTKHKNRLHLTAQGLLLYDSVCEKFSSVVNKEFRGYGEDLKRQL